MSTTVARARRKPRRQRQRQPQAQPARLRELARAWARKKRAIERLEAELAPVARRLVRGLKRAGRTRVPYGRDSIQLIISRKKRPSKTQIAQYFGINPAENFWKGLPDHVSEYLSFVVDRL